MEIRLSKLTLKNFKGVKEFVFEPDGKNANIFGDNATGKTTVFDGFSWLLFDKDSEGKKDFGIKPLDENNQPIHNLETEVEGVLSVDGKVLTLRKVFAEKWTRKRGQAQAEFTGHTTDYFVDEVPVKKKEYEERIAELIDEKLFKLLTSPTYFNEQLHWKERREMVLDVCGDLTDEEVISANDSLKKLSGILEGWKLDDYKAILAGKRKKINSELEKIPVRIDEVNRSLPDIGDIKSDALPADIEKIKGKIKEKQAELSRVENGGEIAEKTKQLREVEAELTMIRTEFTRGIEAQVSGERKRIEELQKKLWELELQTNPPMNVCDESKIQELRDEWHKVNAQEYDGSNTCPTCGQDLPEEMVEEARANFNRQKAEKLEQISAEGKRLKTEIEKAKAENAERDTQAQKAREEIERLKEQIGNISDRISELQESDVSSTPSYTAKAKEKTKIEKAIEDLKAGSVETTKKIKEKLETYETALQALLEAQQKVEDHKRGQARIAELEAQQKKLAKELEKIEEETFLCEEFTRSKVSMLEEKINSKFQFARFKMFDQLVNGGIEECCETLYNGVPYGAGLNNGHRIIVGMDIIRTLSEHYGFYAPIFVDNAESVTSLPEMEAQVIRLVVDEGHKKMNVEVIDNG